MFNRAIHAARWGVHCSNACALVRTDVPQMRQSESAPSQPVLVSIGVLRGERAGSCRSAGGCERGCRYPPCFAMPQFPGTRLGVSVGNHVPLGSGGESSRGGGREEEGGFLCVTLCKSWGTMTRATPGVRCGEQGQQAGRTLAATAEKWRTTGPQGRRSGHSVTRATGELAVRTHKGHNGAQITKKLLRAAFLCYHLLRLRSWVTTRNRSRGE